MRFLKRLSRKLRGIAPRRDALGVAIPSLADLHYNEVLRHDDEVSRAVEWLGWEHPVRWKTWDLLKAACFVREHVPSPQAAIMDAGCLGSPILEVLHTAGYRSLFGCDYSGDDLPRVPGLNFREGDLTRTPWPARQFRAVTCVSVIEHGVDLDRFFAEMARLIQPSGYLLISTDYCEPKVSTDDVGREITLNLPWKIFSRSEIDELVALAERRGFSLTAPMRWDLDEPPVSCWGKRYSFIFFALRRK